MADQTDEEAQRLALEEFQRQQAEKARLAAQGQPNAIPSETPQPVRAVDYADRGLVPTIEAGTPGESMATPAGSPYAAVQGSPLSKEEEDFWAANPAGAVKDPHTGTLVGLGTGPAPQAIQDEYARFGSGQGAPGAPVQQGGVQPLQPKTFSENDFINPAIQGRLDEVRNELARSSQMMRGLSTQRSGKNQMSPFEAELVRFRGLQQAERTLSGELHQRAQIGLATALANARQEEATRHANTGAEMLQWAGSIDDKKYPFGSSARDRYIAQAFASNPAWLAAQAKNPELASQMKSILAGHQTVADQLEALKPYLQEGQTPQITGMGEKGLAQIKIAPTLAQQVATKGQAELAKALATQGVTPEQFAQRTKVEAGTYDKNGNFVNQVGGPHVRVTVGNATFGLAAPQYESLNQTYPATQPQTNAQVDPRIELARRALADPNASEVHKAAARKILGVQ